MLYRVRKLLFATSGAITIIMCLSQSAVNHAAVHQFVPPIASHQTSNLKPQTVTFRGLPSWGFRSAYNKSFIQSHQSYRISCLLIILLIAHSQWVYSLHTRPRIIQINIVQSCTFIKCFRACTVSIILLLKLDTLIELSCPLAQRSDITAAYYYDTIMFC